MNSTFKTMIAAALVSCVMVTGAAGAQTKSKKTPHCYNVEVQRPKQIKDQHKIAGTAIGAVAGGLLGNQVGGGNGKKLATAAGAVGGAFAGRKIQENQQNKTETVIERRCD
ncbi:glycine zipper 2TM domain-containing protein [Lysobacter yananisis]|uniref:Glycine zipper 2TM domain-containing protein n=2 Tax=Lysobacter TaxID=68 RepID=A0A0S2DHS1_LYSEN|nr:surface antigen family protein [Lysobacter enzymogenes]QCW26483.1 glycine zipper 2TM domain-containing protein [Lysobacter enzymogenes]QQQ03643.1 glycine zipper 2TM domain-containing protein [Lysobacter enzymogenes]ROU06061.1 glycine zipper 2TM domain-containing protein [Lysobacter enzymogenes]SDY16857.1 Glycine zipper 2TM domain-containing protein [Lysobacter sp. yr284]